MSTSAYHAEITFRLKVDRQRREPREIQMESLPLEQCRAVGPREDYCLLPYGHSGPCSWEETSWMIC